MNSKEWIKNLKHLEKESQDHPHLRSFFSLIISFLFLFPNQHQKLFLDKKKFVEHFCSRSFFWEIQFFKQYFDFRTNESLISYLRQEDWWWMFFKYINAEKNFLDPYILSNFHESLKIPKLRKSVGFFITPNNQIKVICRYALFYFLKNRADIVLDDKSLYHLIFQCKYPVDFKLKDNHYIVNILSNLKILDPSCGTGLFLIEMNSLLLSLILANPIYANITPEEKSIIMNETFSRLYGFDIDSNSIKLTKIILLQQYLQKTENDKYSEKEFNEFLSSLEVYETNFLEENHILFTKYDIIIGNPPYVRHHGLLSTSMNGLKDTLKKYRDVFPNEQIKWDKKADLYIYFWLKSIMHVFEGGVIAFVLSRAWLSSKYTNPLKKVFKTSFSLDLILELPFEVWESAEIRTHIIIGHKVNENAKPKETAIVVWKKSIESLLLFETQEFSRKLEKYQEVNMTLSIKETDSYRIALISNFISLMMNSRKNFPFLRLDYLTMSSDLVKLLKDKKNQFCLLKDLGKLEMGSTTGANQFFYLNKETLNHYRIPKDYLHLMTKSPKEWKTIFSPSKELRYFLHIPRKLSKDSPRELLNYINEIQYDVLKRPYFKNKTKNNWYQIPLIQPELLIPNMIFKRSFVVYNFDKLHIDKQWIGFWTKNQDWLFLLLGFLNSTLGILLREIQGTRTLGLGSLKLSLQECQNLLVLDPRKISDDLFLRFKTCVSRLGKAKIESIHRNRDLTSEYSKIQNQLDLLVIVECLGLEPINIERIQKILKFELTWRFAKEKYSKPS